MPLYRRWWFVLLATVVLLPIGLILMWSGEIYRRYRGEVVIVPWKEKAQVTFVLALLIGLNVVRYILR